MKKFMAAAIITVSTLISPAVAQQSHSWNPSEVLDTDIVIGSETAPITVVEYASLTCPHCQRFHSESFPEFKKGWIDTGKVKFILRSLPLDQSALAGAMVASCAAKDVQMDVVGVLFSTVSTWAPDNSKIGNVLSDNFSDGFDFQGLTECISDENLPTKVMTPVTAALENGITATPSFVINGDIITGFQTAEVLGNLVNDKIAEDLLR